MPSKIGIPLIVDGDAVVKLIPPGTWRVHLKVAAIGARVFELRVGNFDDDLQADPAGAGVFNTDSESTIVVIDGGCFITIVETTGPDYTGAECTIARANTGLQ